MNIENKLLTLSLSSSSFRWSISGFILFWMFEEGSHIEKCGDFLWIFLLQFFNFIVSLNLCQTEISIDFVDFSFGFGKTIDCGGDVLGDLLFVIGQISAKLGIWFLK